MCDIESKGHQYNIGEKLTVILYTYNNRHTGSTRKQGQKYTMNLNTTQLCYMVFGIGCFGKPKPIVGYTSRIYMVNTMMTIYIL